MAEESEQASGLIKSPQDFIGGVALLAITVVAYFSMTKLGSMRGFSFGAGTVPRLFCLLLGGLSVLIIVTSFTKSGPKLERFPWRGPLFIIASVAFFGLSIRTLGLAITGVITVLLSGAAVDDFRLKEGTIFAVIITAFCAFLFPFALGQPIPLWPKADLLKEFLGFGMFFFGMIILIGAGVALGLRLYFGPNTQIGQFISNKTDKA